MTASGRVDTFKDAYHAVMGDVMNVNNAEQMIRPIECRRRLKELIYCTVYDNIKAKEPKKAKKAVAPTIAT